MATFTVMNTSGEDVLVPALLMVVRDLQNAIVDFHPDSELPPDAPVASMTIPAGGTHTYSVTRTFDRAGVHTAWPAYLDPSTAQLAPLSYAGSRLPSTNSFPMTVFLFVVRPTPPRSAGGAGDIAAAP
jgi:hypothetical protein